MSSPGDASARASHRLAGVFAHPDDDVYLLGGTLALHAGLDVSFVFCTSGEAGPITDPGLATRETLGGVREREQRAAMARLGLEPVATEFLRHPDYYLPDVPFEQLVTEIEQALVREQPHVVVTFGPEGLTSHHDHMRAGEAAEAAFHRARQRGSNGAFQRLYRVGVPRPDVDRFYEEMRGLDPAYGREGELFNLIGVDAGSVAVSVDTTPVRDVKLQAILEHRTQICELERIPEPLRWIHLDHESFVQAWPPRATGEPVADDLFDGVEAAPPTS